VQAGFEAVEGYGPGDISVTGAQGGPWTIEFTGSKAGTSIASIDSTQEKLTPLTAGVSEEVRAEGGSGGPEICVIASECKAAIQGDLGGELVGPQGIAIDSTGDVYVGEASNRRISKFDSDGAFQRLWGKDTIRLDKPADLGDVFEVCAVAAECKAGSGQAGSVLGALAVPSDLAVDSSARVYALDTGAGQRRVQRFQADGSGPEVFAAAQLSGNSPQGGRAANNLAIDPESDHFFADAALGSPAEQRIKEVDLAGTLVDLHAEGMGFPTQSAFTPKDLALDGAPGRLYASFGSANPLRNARHHIAVLDDDGGYAVGSATAPEATEVTPDSAVLEATVNPNGSFSLYRFEISKDAGKTWSAATGDLEAGDGTEDVPAGPVALEDLEANALYQARVIVTTPLGGSATSEVAEFATAPLQPTAMTRPAVQVTDTEAVIRAKVNPNGKETSYRFEWGKTTAYGNSVPVPDGSAGAGGLAVGLSERLEGLDPETTYHYRIVAANEEGGAEGEDLSFTTTTPIAAPPNRAYEMVTPPDKNNRITGFKADYEGTPMPYVGVPSLDGEALFYPVNHVVLSDEQGNKAILVVDHTVIRRGQAAWSTEGLIDVPVAQPPAGQVTWQIPAAAGDLTAFAYVHVISPFLAGSPFGTKLLDDDGGLNGTGWYDWNPEGVPVTGIDDSALIDDDGTRMLRWGEYPGLLGPGDPSNAQVAGSQAIYLQSPPATGPRVLVNECTGTGEAATLIPSRIGSGDPGDTIGAQACEAGSTTSLRGAEIGGFGGAVGLRGERQTALSADGRRVFFVSPDGVAPGGPSAGQSCTTATGPATSCLQQLYVRQLDSEGDPTVRWISRSQVPGQQVGLLGEGVGFEGASADGSIVYFRTNAPLLPGDPNGLGAPTPGGVKSGTASNASWDLYRYELPGIDEDPASGTLIRVSGGQSGEEDPNTGADGQRTIVRFLSDDGERALFVTSAPLNGADNAPPDGSAPSNVPGGAASPEPGTRNLYLFDSSKSGAARWKFVAHLPYQPSKIDGCTTAYAGRIAPLAKFSGSYGGYNRPEGNCVRGTSSADLVVFESTARLTADDDDDAGDIYAYDALADRLQRVSAPPAGQPPYPCDHVNNDDPTAFCNADLGPAPLTNLTLGRDGYPNANVAADGTVFFESRLELIPADTNGRHWDTYGWKDGRLFLVSPGDSDHHAYYSGNSEDGEDVFFWTSQRISPWEIDDADFDVYDARVGGGLPDPPAPALCEVLGGGCQRDSESEAPATAPSASSAFVGPGNLSTKGNRGLARLRRACAKRAGRARGLTRRARSLRRRARRAGAPRVKRRLARRAQRAGGAAKRARKGAGKCRRRLRRLR
jgi:hypothetical protein